METIMFNIAPKTKTHDAVKDYRIMYRVAVAFIAALALLIGWLIAYIQYTPAEVVIVTQTEPVATVEDSAEEAKAMAVAEAVPTEPTAFFALTDEQRTLIEQVVSAESRGEPYDGQVAVAQCILNACLKHDIEPERAIEKYKYTTNRAEPTDSVKEAIAAVFDRGDGVTSEPIIFFYAPELVTSEFHESQDFVIEIGCHRFFKAAE